MSIVRIRKEKGFWNPQLHLSLCSSNKILWKLLCLHTETAVLKFTVICDDTHYPIAYWLAKLRGSLGSICRNWLTWLFLFILSGLLLQCLINMPGRIKYYKGRSREGSYLKYVTKSIAPDFYLDLYFSREIGSSWNVFSKYTYPLHLVKANLIWLPSSLHFGITE